jgi:hypothetical protein
MQNVIGLITRRMLISNCTFVQYENPLTCAILLNVITVIGRERFLLLPLFTLKIWTWRNIWIQAFLFALPISISRKDILLELSFLILEYTDAEVVAVKRHWQKAVHCQRMLSTITALN